MATSGRSQRGEGQEAQVDHTALLSELVGGIEEAERTLGFTVTRAADAGH